MANPEGFSGSTAIDSKIIVTVGAQNVANNSTSVNVKLQVYEASASGSYHLDTDCTYSLSGFDATISGKWEYDFRSNTSYTLINSTRNIVHNADGTKTLTITTAIDGKVPIGTSSPNITVTLPRIPRGPRVKDNGVWRNTIMYVKDNGVWRIAIPYVKDNGTWKIGGG